ncbi:hypothetical protein CPB84DRAFT_283247 [Gymnopilus junonius]|uniref:Uncharacterized protein n=1 Tax=Gymnopilus junonius TaxID=109634 RepID=A0A9P5NDB9_GYMJU|nr:hypothetical protein CPB84DRAFT_283247 [Gymnopilus junonius]
MDDDTRCAIEYIGKNMGSFFHLENVIEQTVQLDEIMWKNACLSDSAHFMVPKELILDALYAAKLCLNQNISLRYALLDQLKDDSRQLGRCLSGVAGAVTDVIANEGIAGDLHEVFNFTRRLMEIAKPFDMKFEKIVYPQGTPTTANNYDQRCQQYYNAPG